MYKRQFSFGDYHDPAHMGFGPLRAINEDVVAPGAGFARHLHHDMEIVTWVLEGELEHQDSLGHTSVIRRGLLQRMTAGTGIEHSEVNASQKLPVRLMQIWMRPDRPGHRPEYEQRHLPLPERRNKLRLAVSGRADDADYTSVWRYEHLTSALPGALTDAVRAEQSNTTISVTLAPELLGTTANTPSLARLAMQQLVWTATATTQQMVPVQVVTASPEAQLFGTLPLQSAFSRSLADGDPRAPVWISSLVDGQAVKVGTAKVTGDAANGTPVRWTLRRTDGDTEAEVATGLATPASDATPAAAGGRSEWQLELPLAQPGAYILEVAVGSWTDTKALRAVA